MSSSAARVFRQGVRGVCCRGLVIVAMLLGGAVGRGDTIVLKDGTIVEGTVVKETSKYVRMETIGGVKSFRRSDITKLVKESTEGSALAAIKTVTDFGELAEMARVLKNAEALYDLQRFEQIAPLVEPWIGKGTQMDDMRIRWLLIESYQRQGQWSKGEELLKRTLSDGREPDKLRAKAHLDIFSQNPGYTLRKIGEKRARNFMERNMYLKGKNPDALQDRQMMQAALTEYVDQILRSEKVSLKVFKDSLNVDATYEDISRAIEAGTSNVVRVLPFIEELRRVEASLYRANAVIPGFTADYELELIRTEAEHLARVTDRLFEPLIQAYPDNGNFPTEGSGKLTTEGREQWRKACDDFLKLARPTIELTTYMLERVGRYPVQLRRFIKLYEDVLERVQQMAQAAERNRDRTHL